MEILTMTRIEAQRRAMVSAKSCSCVAAEVEWNGN
jgi:hypothetical protein